MAHCEIKSKFNDNLIKTGIVKSDGLITNTKLFNEVMESQTKILHDQYNIDVKPESLYNVTKIGDKSYADLNIETFNHIRDNMSESDLVYDIDDFIQEASNTQFVSSYESIDNPSKSEIILTYKKQLRNAVREELNQLSTEEKFDTIPFERQQAIYARKKALIERLDGKQLDDGTQITGLNHEIQLLENNVFSAESLLELFSSDINTLHTIVNKRFEDVTIDELVTAREIRKFLLSILNTDPESNNPIFNNVVLARSNNGEEKAKVKEILQEFASKFKDDADKIIALEQAVVENIFKNDETLNEYLDGEVSYQKMFPKEGLPDISLFDQYIFNILQNVTTETDIVVQEMYKVFEHNVAKEVNRLTKVKKQLQKLNGPVSKILSKVAPNIGERIFYRKTTSGLYTSELVSRYSKNYLNRVKEIEEHFRTAIISSYSANAEESRTIRNEAIRQRNQFYKENHTILNIPSLFSSSDFAEEYEGIIIELSEKGITFERDDEYIKELIETYGENFVNELLEDQKKKINNFLHQYHQKSIANSISLNQFATGIQDDNLRNDETTRLEEELDAWVKYNNPFITNDEFLSDRNVNIENLALIPNQSKYKYVNESNGIVFISSTRFENAIGYSEEEIDSEFYDENFKIIDAKGNEALYEFLKLSKEVLAHAYRNFPERSEITNPDSLSMFYLDKSMFEIIKDKNIPFLAKFSAVYKELLTQISESFRRLRESRLYYGEVDPVTKQMKPRIRNTWFRVYQSEIDTAKKMVVLELIKSFETDKAFGKNRSRYKMTKQGYIDELGTEYREKIIDVMNEIINDRAYLENLLDQFYTYTDGTIMVGQFIEDVLTNKMVLEKSSDVFRTVSNFAEQSALHAARAKALPILNILKEHYARIPKLYSNESGERVVTNNESIMEFVVNGHRNRAVEKFESWFNKRILNMPSSRHTSLKSKLYKNTDDEFLSLERRVDLILNPSHSKMVRFIKGELDEYHKKLTTLIDYVKNSIKNSTNEEEKVELVSLLNELVNKYENSLYEVSATTILETMVSFLRFKALGYNLKSNVTNFLEGHMSNILHGLNETYYSRQSMNKAYKYLIPAMIDKITGGLLVTKNAKKIRALMLKFDVLQDASDILQKSANESRFAKTSSKLGPFAFTQGTEYMNQSIVMIAMMLDKKIKDNKGNEHSLFEAYDENGEIRPEFKNEENHTSWNSGDSNDFLKLKSQIENAIMQIHGDYTNRLGSQIYDNAIGKLTLTFKRWMTSYIDTMYGKERFNLSSGKETKGRFLSFTKTDMASLSFTVSAMTMSISGLFLGPLLARVFTKSDGARYNKSVVHNILSTNGALLLNILGMPVNMISRLVAGKQLIDISSLLNGYEDQIDKKNMLANISQLTNIIYFRAIALLLTLAFGGKFEGDDDDDDKLDTDENEEERQSMMDMLRPVMAVTANISNSIHSGMMMFYSPIQVYDNMVDLPILSMFRDWGNIADVTVNALLYDDEVYTSGKHAGEKKTDVAVHKAFGSMAITNWFGFGTASEDIYFKDKLANEILKPEDVKQQSLVKQQKEAILKEIRDSDLSPKEKKEAEDKINSVFRKKKTETQEERYERVNNIETADEAVDKYDSEPHKKRSNQKKHAKRRPKRNEK